MRVITWRGLVVIAEGDVTPDTLHDLRRDLWRSKVRPSPSGYYDLVLTENQSIQLEQAVGAEYLVVFAPVRDKAGLGLCEGFRITDIASEYPRVKMEAMLAR